MNFLAKAFNAITPLATVALITVAFYMASRSFWGVELTRGEVIACTTILFASTAWLLSSVLPTVLKLHSADKDWAAVVLCGLGVILFLMEASIVHTGLEWYLSRSLTSHITLDENGRYYGAFGLSLFNIFARWAYVEVVAEIQSMDDAKNDEKLESEALELAKSLPPREYRRFLRERINTRVDKAA